MALAVVTFAVLIGTFPPITSSIGNHGFRGSLTGPHAQALQQLLRRDARRLTFLAPAPTTSPTLALQLQALAENGAGAYHVNLSIGTPPLTFPAMLDTGSDLVWTQCAPCTECFAQPTPLYDPASSSTFSRLPCASPLCRSLPSPFHACNDTGCAYDYRYVVGFTAGLLAAETQ